ncbi:MAG: HlyD family type I secretion periplasmic adaptor subunit [Parvibaculaceae bacterium]
MALFGKKATDGKDPKTDLSKKLALPLSLEENGPPRFYRHLMLAGGVFLALAILWGSITEIRELARANGEVTPAGQVQLVQHLEGGIVSEVLVNEGQIVEAGEPLIRLQPIAAEGDLGQLTARRAALEIKIERLSAFVEARPMDPSLAEIDAELFGNEDKLLQASLTAAQRQRDGFLSRIEQRQTDIESLSEQRLSLKEQVDLMLEQVNLRQTLMEKGLMSRIAFLETKRSLEQTRVQLISTAGNLAAAREALLEEEAGLEELDATLINDALDKRATAASELAETESAIRKLTDRVVRLTVSAPVRGIVQDLSVKAIGEVVEPGGLVAQVVPMDDELVAEVRVMPDDIGHIQIGHPAKVKITTYDPARFGAIDGEVRRISASTFRDENNEPYYKVIIALSKAEVGLGSTHHAVLPGMVVNAEIVTGSKSLVRYLLKPVFRSLDIAFTER